MKRGVLVGGVFAIEFAMAFALLPWTKPATLNTTDFVNFYAAATIVRQGRAAVLYQAQTQAPLLHSLLGRQSRDYFLHPPFFAAGLAPLSYLSIEKAFVVWTLLNMALLGLLPVLFGECTEFVRRRPQLGLVGILFFPILVTLTLGQDSILLMFLVSAAYSLLKRGRDGIAGFILSAATIKFQYVLVIVGFLLLQRRWKVVATFAGGCAVLVAFSVVLLSWNGVWRYIDFVHDYDVHGGYGAIHTAQMVNWRGFFAGMGWPKNIRLYASFGSIASLVFGAVCSRFIDERNASIGFALFVTLSILASPYAYFQDATLLLLPLYLAIDYALQRSGAPNRKLLFGCGFVFIWPLALLLMGGHYWWNSRIYLMFPVILAFALILSAELYATRRRMLNRSDRGQRIAVS
jgi:hypothetical protein